MTDPIPDHTNRLAYIIGRLFHPMVICIPTLALLLNDLPWQEAFLWTVLIAAIVTGPGLITIALLQRQQRYVYQRQTRQPVYLIAWLSVVTCFVIIIWLDGPEVLRVCIAALIVWLPLQLFINSQYTKISTHVAVAAGCGSSLWLLGKLDHPLLQIAVLLIIGLTMWARITTRNHTPVQVVLGFIVATGTVLVVFSFLLR